MNFLSHYHLDASQDPQQNFGLLLPDFLGIIDRKTKLRHFLEQLAEDESSIQRGIALHLRADAVWHNSPFFQEKTAAIKKVLSKWEWDSKPYRPFFMTHVMLELLLDRTLVKDDESTAYAMYESLEQADANWLRSLFANKDLGEKMSTFVARFLEYRYVLEYQHNERFVYALNRLFQRVGHPELKFRDDAELNIFVQQLDHCIESDYDIIFPIIRQVEP